MMQGEGEETGFTENGDREQFEIEQDDDDDDDYLYGQPEEEPSTRFYLRWVTIVLLVTFGTGGAVHVLTVSRRHVDILNYSCPTTSLKVAENYNKKSFDLAYGEDTKMIKTNLTGFMESFRAENFDDWGKTYEEVKKGMYNWKSKYFTPNIKNGESIYESACGVGLNLYMTLEILHEVGGIKDLVVYGNEYLDRSTEKANVVFDKASPFGAKKGKICTGDSTDLSYIPSNAFDLVYTGYISPIMDPLHYFEDDKDLEGNFQVYTDLCGAKDDKSKKLVEIAQEKQNDFYGRWVGEMVRIAKPGKAIIIEQVSRPYCDELFDWGGVRFEFWRQGVARYSWDVDPNSFQYDRDVIFHDRYHVFMRKNR